ncbi:hypothetical protein [Paenibacillus xylanexedens]|uniref:hypothetical protein n=1 Tax=Paenibacillus xylanexedens TaxID=528191 RepID=UPI00119D44AA|nr:hypothetical protein [Paenibacillus xylanexedens]
MDELEKLFIPYALLNVTVVSKNSGELSLLYAVDSKGENALIGDVKKENTKDWHESCKLVTKKMFLEEYRFRK